MNAIGASVGWIELDVLDGTAQPQRRADEGGFRALLHPAATTIAATAARNFATLRMSRSPFLLRRRYARRLEIRLKGRVIFNQNAGACRFGNQLRIPMRDLFC